MSDLGVELGVHRKAWRGNIYAAVIIGCVALVLAVIGRDARDVQTLAAICGAATVLLVASGMHARRTRVVMHERGFAWHRESMCDEVAWSEIASVDGKPTANYPVWIAVELTSGKVLVIPQHVERFEELCTKLGMRAPVVAAKLPVARVVSP